MPLSYIRTTRSYQCRNERTAIDGDEWLVAPWPGVMNGLGYPFFPCAGFAKNQHRMRTLGGLCDQPVEFLHFLRSADDAAKSLIVLELLASHPAVGFATEIFGDPL